MIFNLTSRRFALFLVVALLSTRTFANTIFVSDPRQRAIWKIDEGSVPSIFVQVNAAPLGLAVDSSGDLFVGLAAPPSIIRVDATGHSSVFVGSGLQFPTGLAFDRHGNLYVCDNSAQSIYRYDQSGVRSTFASNLHGPIGLAFDREGNLFVANSSDSTIVKLAPDGSASLFAGPLTERSYGLAFDSLGRLYLSANDGHGNPNSDQIVRFERDGSSAVFASPLQIARGLAFDGRGFLYALDFSSTPLTRFDANANRSSVISDQMFNQNAQPTFLLIQPDSATPLITAAELAGNKPRITFMSSQTFGYALQRCTDLTAADWNPVTGAADIFGTGGPIAIDGPDTIGGTARFYRVRTMP